MAALGLGGFITPFLALMAAGACFLIAALIAAPIVGDLDALAEYGDALARNTLPPEPELSGWSDSAELAARFRRIAREWQRNAQSLKGGTISSQTVFDSLPQPLMLLDRTRKVLRANRTARTLIGIDPTGTDLAGAIRDPAVLALADDVLAGQEIEAVSLTLQGATKMYFSVHIVPLVSQTETPTAKTEIPHGGAAALVVLYDLTERRMAEQMHVDFIANASHELRTPLASLVGFIETLRGPARNDETAQEKFLGLMASQASRMGRLVEDLLSLSAIELAEHTQPSDRVDLSEILGDIAEGLKLEAETKDMALVQDFAPDLPNIVGDKDQLTQLFQNLIDNAIKYGAPKSDVKIHAHPLPDTLTDAQIGPHGGYVQIDVIDQGDGIGREHLPRLTERFYRADAARSRAIGGTGLGLAIVKHITTRHRGTLDISSAPNKGSTFSVRLPINLEK
ncbi:MAG: sensor histidine kinase [Alphaproteobacteria bacterium]